VDGTGGLRSTLRGPARRPLLLLARLVSMTQAHRSGRQENASGCLRSTWAKRDGVGAGDLLPLDVE